MIRSKPKTPRSSLNDKSELKSHGRWSPIKITPMRSQKLFEVILKYSINQIIYIINLNFNRNLKSKIMKLKS